MANINTDTLYIKMKTESGGEAWRNVAPSVGTGTKRLNFNYEENDVPGKFTNLIRSFACVQTETLALDNNGQVQYKVVSEHYMSGSKPDNIIIGTDAWTDTTDEKLVVSVTNGDVDGKAKLPKAASALGAGSSITYGEAVSNYSQAVAQYYQLGDDSEEVTWLQTHLTGTKDTLVAQNS